MSSKAKKGKKKKPSAKIHRVTGRHETEMKLMAYTRRLDKIYAKLNMPATFLKVVQLLRNKYKDNPHELYLKVCKKWGVEPQDEVDGEFLVYGRSRSLSRSRRNLLKEQVKEVEKNTKPEVVEKKEVKKTVEEENKEDENAQAPPAGPSAVEQDSEAKEAQAEPEVKKDDNEPRVEYVSVNIGDIVETMVLIESTSDRESGFWVPAQILSINESAMNMDLQVLQPLKYDLAERAMAVPYRYVRSPATVTFEY